MISKLLAFQRNVIQESTANHSEVVKLENKKKHPMLNELIASERISLQESSRSDSKLVKIKKKKKPPVTNKPSAWGNEVKDEILLESMNSSMLKMNLTIAIEK